MSGSVDNKVVKMTFDNAAFEKNVRQTMSSIADLKKSLNFDGAKNGLADIGASAGKVNLSPIHTQIESINAGFLALATVAATVLSGLTSKAVSAGASMVKALTITPALDGFKEYETNMNSVQTIMANTQSKGTTLDEVNAALDQMNTYSDKTIYNFSEMAKNVGTFTAAGVDLNTSVSSIKGIANLAALSGSSSEQASTAMYQLSQAIAAGSVKLMDWNSVVNAGMGGEQFKNALVQTGQALGELTKQPVGQTFNEWEAANGSFRETLKDGWVTADVLTTTLGALSGDLSAVQMSDMGFSDEQVVQMQKLGETARDAATQVKTATQLISTIKESLGSAMSLSFRTVIGDFIEAKGLYTNLNNFIGGFIARSSAARATMLAEWKWFGGRNELMAGLMASLGSVESVLRPIGAAFREAFPKKTSEDLYNLTKAFREFAEKMLLSENGAKRVKQIFSGVFSILAIGVAIVKGVFSVFKALATVFFEIIGGFGGAAGSVGDFISKIRELLVDKGGIAGFFKIITDGIYKLGDVVAWVRERLAGVFDFVKDKTAGKAAAVIDTVTSVFSKLGAAAVHLAKMIPDAAAAIQNFFVSLYNGFMSTDFGQTIRDTLSSVQNFFASIYDAITGVDIGGAASKALSGVQNFFDTIWAKVSGWAPLAATLTDLRNSFLEFFDGLFDSTKNAGQGFGTNLDHIADSIGSFVGNMFSAIGQGLRNIGTFLSNMFSAIFDGIKDAGGPITDAITVFIDNLKNAFKTENLNKILAVVGTGIFASLTNSFRKIAKNGLSFNLIPEDMVDGFTDALDNIGGAIKSFQNNLRADTLLKVAFAMIVLSGAIIALSFVDPQKIAISLGALATGVTTLVAAIGLMSKMDANGVKLTGMGIAIMGVAAAVLILAAAVYVFGTMDPDVLKQGMASISVALIGLGAAAALMSKAKGGLIQAAISVGILGVALIIFAQAIKYFNGIDVDTMKKGMGIIGGLLIGFAILSNIVDGDSMVKFSVALGGVSASMWALSKVIERFGNIPFEQLKNGLFGFAAVLTIVIASLWLMPDEKKAKQSAINLLLMSAALFIMSKAVETLGKMGLAGLVAGVIALAAVMTLLVVGALLMVEAQPGAYAMLILAAALAVMAGAIYLIGQLKLQQIGLALGAIAAMFLIFVAAGFLLAPVIIILLAFGAAMLMIGTGVILFGAGLALTAIALMNFSKLSGKSFKQIAKNVVEFIKIFPQIARALAEAFVEIIVVIGESAGKIADALGDLFIKLLEKLQEIMPVLGQTIGVFIDTLIILLVAKVPEIIAAGIILITALLTGIRDNIGTIVMLGIEIMTNFLNGLAQGIPLMGQAIRNLIAALVNEVTANVLFIINAGVFILVSLLNGIAQAIPQIVTAVGNVITAFITAIGSEMTRIIDVGVITLLSFLWGITNNATLIATEIGKMFDQLLDAISTLITGDSKGNGGIVDKAIDFVVKFLDSMVDDAIGFAKKAGAIIVKLLNGIEDFIRTDGKKIRDAGASVADAIIDGITGGLSNKVGKVVESVKGLVGNVLDAFTGKDGGIDSGSPSKVFIRLAGYIGDGIVVGLKDDARVVSASKDLAQSTITSFGAAMSGASDLLTDMGEFNPTITPVLDLTRVKADASNLAGMLGSAPITASLSAQQARYLSTAQAPANTAPEVAAPAGPSEIKFEQNIYAPAAISADDVYRGTRSQIALAKEELQIP